MKGILCSVGYVRPAPATREIVRNNVLLGKRHAYPPLRISKVATDCDEWLLHRNHSLSSRLQASDAIVTPNS